MTKTKKNHVKCVLAITQSCWKHWRFIEFSNLLGMPIAGFCGIQSNANNFMGFEPECSRNSFQLWLSAISSPVFFSSLLPQNCTGKHILLWKVISFLPLYTSLLRDRAGGRRQKTLLICNPPLPLTQVFTQTSFHSFQHFLPVQLKGVHFKHWVNMNLSETFGEDFHPFGSILRG